jgi:hypothetical protein
VRTRSASHPDGRGAADHQLGDADHRGGLGIERAHDLPVAQHGDVVGDLEDLVEPVGDEQDPHALARERAHDAEELGGLALGEHRGGLVEDQEPDAALVDLARDLDELHVTDRHAGERQPLVDAQADLVERAPGIGAGGAAVDERERRPEQARQQVGDRRLAVELDVLRDREAGDQHELLVHHAETRRHRLAGRGELHLGAVEHDAAAIAAGVVDHRHAEQDVHEGGLARAVLAHQRVDRPRPHGQRHALENGVALVLLRDVVQLEDGSGHGYREWGRIAPSGAEGGVAGSGEDGPGAPADASHDGPSGRFAHCSVRARTPIRCAGTWSSAAWMRAAALDTVDSSPGGLP